ncbi:MAG: hypothetical protein IBX58_05975 [Roseovarius sp.]|nr:hypothetical protein [Roseovarius sp.]
MQKAILLDHLEEIPEASRICPDGDKIRAIHDYRPRVLDTLFRRFHVKAPRIHRCACKVKPEAVSSGRYRRLPAAFGRSVPARPDAPGTGHGPAPRGHIDGPPSRIPAGPWAAFTR